MMLNVTYTTEEFPSFKHLGVPHVKFILDHYRFCFN